MPVDDDLYNRMGETWWDDANPLPAPRSVVNPARFRYFRRVLSRLQIDLRSKRCLDVGCGGGFLAEEFAHPGCHVIGVDPSEVSIATARAHARSGGLAID